MCRRSSMLLGRLGSEVSNLTVESSRSTDKVLVALRMSIEGFLEHALLDAGNA